MNRAKPCRKRREPCETMTPCSTVPRPIEPRVFYGFKLTAPLNTRSNGCWLDVHGAVRFRWHSYGAVWCGFKYSGILQCGSVRFSDFVYPAVRFGAVIYPTLWFGAALKIENPTVRFGAVFKNRKCYGEVRCFHVSYGAVRCGFQKSGILRCGAVRF